MDQIVCRLYMLENVAQRLKALSDARGVPNNTAQQMRKEYAALFWAYKELRKVYLTTVLLVVGHESCLRSIPAIDNDRLIECDDLFAYVEFAPDRLITDKIKDYLAPDWEGNILSGDKTPKWLLCSRYYASMVQDGRAIMFDCSVPKLWLDETGRNSAKDMLVPWMIGIFGAMQWDKAREVQKGDGEDGEDDE